MKSASFPAIFKGMRWGISGVLLALAAAGSACTLLVDTSDLANGPKPADAGRESGVVSVIDSGASDASTDGPVEAAAPATCPPDAMLCEDFENGLGKFDVHNDNGRTELVTDVVHGGKTAFRATSHARDAGNNQAELRFNLSQPITNGDTVYFRVYVYFPTALVPESTISKWRTPIGTSTDDINLKIDAQGHFKIDADNAKEGPELSGINVAPIGRWLCVDWTATFGTPGHELLSVDGTTEIDKDENNYPPATINEIGFGFVAAAPTKTMSVLFDDIIVSKSRVGCP